MATKLRLTIDVSINKPIEELDEQEYIDLSKRLEEIIKEHDENLRIANNTGFLHLLEPEFILNGAPMYGPINPNYKPQNRGLL